MKIKTIFTSLGKAQKLLAAVIGILAIYCVIGVYFNTHFFFRTTINGVECSTKSIDGVEKSIQKEADDFNLVLEERNDSEESISGKDISIRVDFDDSIEKLLKKQNGFLWVKSIFAPKEYEIDTLVEYDEEALETVLSQLNCMDKEQMVAPENATISEYSKEKGYEAVAAEEGTTIDEEAFYAAVKEAIVNFCETLNLSDAGCYESAEYAADSKKVKKILKKLNTYVGTVVTYDFGSASEVVDGSTIKDWISVDEDFNIQLDKEAMAAFVSTMANKYNTIYSNRTFTSSTGSEVTVKSGDYGWWMDQNSTLSALEEYIKAGTETTADAVWFQEAESHEGNDFGKTYVEVNLTKQHLYYYIDGELIVESDFVSGNVSQGNGTPAGTFSITYTERDATLNGENYSTPVTYWMPFNGNIGLHDASWRSSFGGNIYKTGGSHGCVNLPPATAKTIFEHIAKGDCVIVYEEPGYETSSTTGTTSEEKDEEEDSTAEAKAAAKKVTAKISSIGTVTKKSATKIEAARNAYDKLSKEAKTYVENYATLTKAEKKYKKLTSSADSEETTQDSDAEATKTSSDTSTNEESSSDKETSSKKSSSKKSKKKKNNNKKSNSKKTDSETTSD